MPGRIGADYEIIREMRRGPWVTVYEARHRVLGRRTLVKWLNPEHENDEEMAGRLKREARLGAAVDHPNAARIYGVGEAEGRPYVAIEWIEGEDLETLLEREGALPFERVLRLAKDLLAGLAAIHEAGVTHRDLSPANVRIAAGGIARITDFGLATGAFDPRYTLPGSVVGTPGYLAPEQASGKDVDHRADQFALGVLLYEALTAKTLFRDKDLISTLKRVRTQPAPPLDSLVSDLPKGFSPWVDRLLEKEPESRFEDVSEAIRSLDKIKPVSEIPSETVIPESQPPGGLTIPARILPAIITGLVVGILVIVGYQMINLGQKRIDPPGLVISKNDNKGPSDDKDSLTDLKRDTTNPNTSSTLPQVRTPDAGGDPERPKQNEGAGSSSVPPEAPVRTQQQAASLPDTSGTGVLIVRTRPWAEVYVNDDRIGSTPSLPPQKLDAGRKRITLSNPGFPSINIDTLVYSQDTTLLNIDLLKELANLEVIVVPWAKVFLDDAHVGDTPAFRNTFLAPGRHRLRLTHPEFGEVKRDFTILAGDTLEISVDIRAEGTAFAATEE